MTDRPYQPELPEAGDRGQEARSPQLVADNAGLAAINIGKSFKKRPVLRGVSVALERGEAVGLLGPNGAGKTTCFYMITGLLAPDYGWVTLDGHDITDLPMYRRARLGTGSTTSSTLRMFCSTVRPRKIEASCGR